MLADTALADPPPGAEVRAARFSMKERREEERRGPSGLLLTRYLDTERERGGGGGRIRDKDVDRDYVIVIMLLTKMITWMVNNAAALHTH